MHTPITDNNSIRVYLCIDKCCNAHQIELMTTVSIGNRAVTSLDTLCLFQELVYVKLLWKLGVVLYFDYLPLGYMN